MLDSSRHPLSAWATLATFDSRRDANGLKARLQKEGIKEVVIQDERWLQRIWLLASPRAGVHVLVLKKACQRARTFMDHRLEAFPWRDRIIRCPECHSSRVHYPAMTRKNILPTIVAHILVVLRIMEHEYYCEECHCTWTRARSRGTSRPNAGQVQPDKAR